MADLELLLGGLGGSSTGWGLTDLPDHQWSMMTSRGLPWLVLLLALVVALWARR